MSSDNALQLSTLPTRHPSVGAALLKAHAFAAVIRLSLDPSRPLDGTMSRAVTVDWKSKTAVDVRVIFRTVGWDGIPNLADECAGFRLTWNDHDTTEMAAIAVMAVLINDLEGGVLKRVLPIGSGGDYLVLTTKSTGEDQVEISGVWRDPNGRPTRQRLAAKCEQVLTHSDGGFASVTAFSHPPEGGVCSFLHYVEKRPGRSKRKGRRRR